MEIIENEQTPKVRELIGDNLKKNIPLINNYLAFCETLENCAGLAANQVSIGGKRLMFKMFAIKKGKKFEAIIDPEIIKQFGTKETKLETCLSWKGRTISAERFSNILVNYTDIEGKVHNKTIKGFEAQVWQHETDHLEGIEENFITSLQPNKRVSTGRNETCPCGSGKKYKKCCMF